MGIIFCGISFSVLLLLIFSKKSEFSIIIFWGLLLRLVILFIDLNHVFPVLHSGTDTEAFHMIALRNQYMAEEQTLTNYTIFLTRLYSVFGGSNPRMVAQFINVIFGIGVLLVIRHCLSMLNIAYKTKKLIMQIAAFMPNFAIFSAILLREAWVEFFAAVSMLFFLRWFLGRGNSLFNMVLCVSLVFAASYMHAGIIGLALGYMIAFTMYNPVAKTVKISFSTFLSIALAVGVFTFFLANINTVGGKFAGVEMSEEYITEELTTAASAGGSNYMSWLQTSSPVVGLVTLPIRMALFLFSPLPIFWRGLNDVLAFLIDGLIYLLLMWHILRSRIGNPVMNRLRKFLLTSILITAMIFGLGTSTAGTAIRHRAKCLSVILVTYGVAREFRDRSMAITKTRKG